MLYNLAMFSRLQQAIPFQRLQFRLQERVHLAPMDLGLVYRSNGIISDVHTELMRSL